MTQHLLSFILASATLVACLGVGPRPADAQAKEAFKAEAPHDAAHQENPTNWCGLHAARNELVQALSDCTYALSVNPDDVQALSNRGSIYLVAKDARAALADFNRAIALKSGEPTLHFNRGVALSDLGQSDPAIADYSEAIRLRPDLVIALHNRGYEYELKGDRVRAIADYEAALRIKPDLPQSLKRLEGLRRSL